MSGSKPDHIADKVDIDGRVSASCFRGLKPIDLKVATWTNRAKAVTCARCSAALKATRHG